MRRLFAILTLSAALAGCDKQPDDNGQLDISVNEPITTSIRVSVDETRAAGVDSAEGIFENDILGSEDVTMRYIMQIYVDGVATDMRYVAYSDTTNVEFTPELIPNHDYKFVVWADVVTKAAGETKFIDVDNHYNTKNEGGLANITIHGEWSAMDETRDAFTGFADKENFTGGNVVVNLTRPFAKLRIVATDKSVATPVRGVVKYTSDHSTGFNAVTGRTIATSTAEKEHDYIIGTYTNDASSGTDLTLFTDYLFADDSSSINLSFAFYEEGNSYPIMNKTFTAEDVSIRPNQITTIKGKILCGGEMVVVTADIDGTYYSNGGKNDIMD